MVNLTDPPLGLAAAGYSADHDWSVVPCVPGDKPPLWGLRWEDASSEPEQIMEWWSMAPTANVGVACVGDLVVLDVDGPEGEATLAELEERYGHLPYTREVATGRRGGGRHLYFLRPDGLEEGWRYRGLELKASGYVLAPPSVHPDTGAWYYTAEDGDRAPLPEWLQRSPKPVQAPLPQLPSSQDQARLQRAAETALEGELAKLANHSSEPGSGRHTAVYAAAAALGHHVRAGGISRGAVEARLWEVAPALGLAQDAETWHQIQSGLAEGMEEPYVLRERPMGPRVGSFTIAGEAPPPPQPTARRRNFALMTPQLLEWLWVQRVPLGKLTVLAGLPGQGKSLLTCWLAARASRGELDHGEPMDVLLVSAEDDPEDTILPRLLRCGADLARVDFLDVRDHAEGEGFYRSVALPSDTKRILDTWKRGLLVLDPIGGLLDADHDGYKAQHVRRALGPLKQAAEERRAPVVLIQHLLTKAQTSDPLAKLADSHAYAALPRSVLLFGPDPEDEQEERGSSKVLLLAKSNVAGRGEHGLRFSITDASLVGWRGGIGWSAGMRLEGPTAVTAADTLASSDDRSALREATEWLRGELANGPEQAGVMIKAAELAGIAERTLRRARGQVCKRPYKKGPGPWYWELKAPLGQVGQDGHLPEAAPDQEGGQGGQGGQIVVQLFPDDPEET